MNRLLVIIILIIGSQLSYVDLTAQVIPLTPEMQEQINEMKNEIKELEEEIKLVEQSDPEEAKMLKTQLTAMKSMLQMLEPSATKKTNTAKESNQEEKPPVMQIAKSPIVPVILKQPVYKPTPQQIKDKLLWYSGKKVNDSTLITGRGVVVQLSQKRNMVKLQPEKKSDQFAKIVQEIEKNEQRKEELVDRIDKMQNGFLYYPQLVKALEMYDKMAKDYGYLVKNTIDLPELPDFSASGNAPSPSGHGPNAGDNFYYAYAEEESTENITQYFRQKLDRAKKLASELPPVGDFPAPPAYALGMCIDCDPKIAKQREKQDKLWFEKYSGKESEILQLLLEVERAKALLNVEAVTKDTTDYFRTIGNPISARMQEKNKLLYSRYGKDIRYKDNVNRTILGYERQRQLLGMEEENSGSFLGEMMSDGKSNYEKYFNEQVEVKNHDFVLNMSSHLGMARQAALLGADEDGLYFQKLLDKYLKYNRFELTSEIDFIYEQRTDDNELEFKATGKLETTEKQFIMFYPDSCNFKVQPYNKDLQKIDIRDITIPFAVISGVKTQYDEDGNLANYQYSGPAEFPLMFPDFRIDFCNNAKPDTAWFFTFTGNIDAAATPGNLNELNKSYKDEIIAFANFVFLSDDDIEENEDDLQNMGLDMIKTIVGFQTDSPADTKLGRLKQSYDGITKMDNYRKGMQGLMSSKKSAFLFTANNKSTVLADKFNDSKRTLEEDIKLVRGMVHLRVVHQPIE